MTPEQVVTPTTIETFSGVFFDLKKPESDHILISDIAWALSRISRYTGHTASSNVYTVAQHSVNVLSYARDVINVHENETRQEFKKFLTTVLKRPDLVEYFESHDWASDERTVLQTVLTHDYAEAYIGDIPSPVKCLPGVSEAIKFWEHQLLDEIRHKFGVKYKSKVFKDFCIAVTKFADLYALRIEAHFLMPSRGLGWSNPISLPSPQFLENWESPKYSFSAFSALMRAHESLFTSK